MEHTSDRPPCPTGRSRELRLTFLVELANPITQPLIVVRAIDEQVRQDCRSVHVRYVEASSRGARQREWKYTFVSALSIPRLNEKELSGFSRRHLHSEHNVTEPTSPTIASAPYASATVISQKKKVK